MGGGSKVPNLYVMSECQNMYGFCLGPDELCYTSTEAVQMASEQKASVLLTHAVQSHVEAAGFSVVREFVGHGIGSVLHEDLQIPNFGRPGVGQRLRGGMVLAIEPMVNMGTHEVEILGDGWTAVTKDRRPSAHFEHSVAITEEGPWVLSAPQTHMRKVSGYA